MLPLFPLSLVAFPSEPVNLHIFEPRYRQLVKECIAEKIPFGIVPFIDGKLMSVGTRMFITSLTNTYPTGEMDIQTKGDSLFKVLHLENPMPTKLYAGAEVQPINSYQIADTLAPNTESVLELFDQFQQLTDTELDFKDFEMYPLSFQLGHKIGFSLAEEFLLLQMSTENHRLAFIANHLREAVEMLHKIERAKKMIALNGHFKYLDPLKF
ncbi:MAG: LON peptidase substrate-binding domain-containing protein [Spirosomataceae bacterium]